MSQVIDDFLPEAEFTTIKNFLMASAIYKTMPFTYKHEHQDNLDDFSLQTNLLMYPSIVEPLLNRLQAQETFVCRANVIMRRDENVVGGFHRDVVHREDVTTAVLYINDCNGGTAFKDGKFVQSKANRAVIFNNTDEHAGVWQTDVSFSYVVNINFLQVESYREHFWSPL